MQTEINVLQTLGIVASRGINDQPVVYNPPPLPLFGSDEPRPNDLETKKVNQKSLELLLSGLTLGVLLITLINSWK